MIRHLRLSVGSIWALGLVTTPAAAQSLFPGFPAYGEEDLEKFGRALATIGDVNHDGIDDIAVGVPESDAGKSDAGAVVFYSGADPQVELGRFLGSCATERAGWALAPLGDVSGDRVPDLAVGAPEFDGVAGNDQGRIIFVSGADFTEIGSFTTDVSGSRLGHTVASAGDRNGDGFDELLVGAPQDGTLVSQGGAAFLLSLQGPGPAGGEPRHLFRPVKVAVLHRFDAVQVQESFGFSAVCLGDVTGDGQGELAIGSPNFHGLGFLLGRVQVFSGDASAGYPLVVEIQGFQDFEQLGYALDEISDPRKTGQPCLLVSQVGLSVGQSLDTGGCTIFELPSGQPLRVYNSQAAGMFLGTSICAVPDQNDDGVEDILIGGSLDSSGGLINAGVVELLDAHGDGTFMQRLYRIRGTSAADHCGEAVLALPDLNGDGYCDLAWSCSTATNPTTGLDTGSVDVVHGREPSLRTDMPFYQDFDTVTMAGHGYANENMIVMLGSAPDDNGHFKIAFDSPYLLINGFVTDSDGYFELIAHLPGTGQTQYQLYFQVFVTLPTNLLYSELATVNVN